VCLDGEEVRFKHPSEAIAAGVAFVPESREDAVFADLPVYQNLSPVVLGRYVRGLRLSERRMRADARALMGQYGIKAASERAPLRALSGGNQQKVVMARWLRSSPRLLLLDEPTHGVDVGARADIYRLVRDAVADGAAALVVTSDLEEMAHVVDRAIVLRGGRALHHVARHQLTPERLTELSYAEEEPSRA
jgi:ribose transport system ATP-binding protein